MTKHTADCSKLLVAGWFSFEQMGATAGDLLARDLVCEWIASAGREFEIATAPPFAGGIDWKTANSSQYSDVVFVCGPFGNGSPVTEFMERFQGRRFIGVNLSMLEPLDVWNPFDVLIERDSSIRSNPDLTFLSAPQSVPLVGLILVHPQTEYSSRAMHEQANEALERILAEREAAIVRIDTRLDVNSTHLRTPNEVESLISRMDLVVTTRVHGTVLALKHGVPAVVVDPISGGAKVQRQARTIGWPVVFSADMRTAEQK